MIMAYYVRIIRDGTLTLDSSPYPTREHAMTIAGTLIRNGLAEDAWIDDHNQQKVADLADIKKHCSIA
jgi:hypothetical protein